MLSAVFKLTRRSIRSFWGRYIALLLIVALSAGFFAGLKVTTDAMIETGSTYFTKQNLYDYRLISTLGFTKEDVGALGALDGIEYAEGTNTVDAMVLWQDNNLPFKLMAIPEKINLPSLTAGRMPVMANECLADDNRFTKDDIGSRITLSNDNDDGVRAGLENSEYTIVGLVDSPLYLNLERGTTGIGSGALHSFIYIPSENFHAQVFTEVNLMLSQKAEAYSEAYDELVEESKGDVLTCAEQLAEKRYESILSEAGLTAASAQTMGITEPSVYVLTRSENTGYVSFENDTAIIGGVANIFPVFFILIAMLVCITTMTRMVDEERTQLGVLKAMGFGNRAIIMKYMLYAGSATILGWILGFALCTWALPQIFWFAYKAIYDFSPMSYYFSLPLAVITLTVSLLGILGSTYISCRKELISMPAHLIRPRAAKTGKRILLERITPLWKRFSFLQKITLRNMFRYKRRLIMMLVGIGCCAGLVVTAFGVRDSMINIGSLQYGGIQKYDMEAVFAQGAESAVSEALRDAQGVEDYLTGISQRIEVMNGEESGSANLLSFREMERLSDFWSFASEDTAVPYPGKGEVIVNNKLAEKFSLEVGDSITVRDAEMRTAVLRVSAVYDNYIAGYVLVTEETYTEAFGEWQANSAFVCVNGDCEETAKMLTAMEEVTSVSQLASSKRNVDEALSCLDYIIWLVVGFSGALAFIVIFNLTNINLAERSREIATVQVLGFHPNETNSYVLRENLMMSFVASLIGMPLGTLFHRVVMHMINIDMFGFNIHVRPVSYLMAFVCTLLFAVLVNRFMRRQIGKIRMAESLKAVE